MSKQATKNCDRCGRLRQVKRSRRSDVCADCRLVDPAYVKAITEGKRCA